MYYYLSIQLICKNKKIKISILLANLVFWHCISEISPGSYPAVNEIYQEKADKLPQDYQYYQQFDEGETMVRFLFSKLTKESF